MFWKLATFATNNFTKTITEYPTHNILERNFLRLSDVLSNCSETPVALFGQPGAGKSTLLNTITEGNCFPKPIVSQKTDATDWSMNTEVTLIHSYKENNKLMYFIDTPGYGTTKHPPSSYDYFPYEGMSKIIFVVRGKLQQADQEMFSRLTMIGLAEGILLVRTLSEDLTEEERMKVKIDLNRNLKYKHLNVPLIFASSRTGEGISSIRQWMQIQCSRTN